MLPQDMYSNLWTEMDELLLRYPELSAMWLDRSVLSAVQSRFPNPEEQREYFRKRAFVALVMERLFRIYQNHEEALVGAGEETEGITIDNPEFLRIWYESGIRDEYSEYPDFVEYAEKNIFDQSA